MGWFSFLVGNLASGKPTRKRSPQWKSVRAEHLSQHDHCAVCGVQSRLEVHHIMPYHLFPHLELSPANLITLCESGTRNCHFMFGHLLDWKSWNEAVKDDAVRWREKIALRPGTRGLP